MIWVKKKGHLVIPPGFQSPGMTLQSVNVLQAEPASDLHPPDNQHIFIA